MNCVRPLLVLVTMLTLSTTSIGDEVEIAEEKLADARAKRLNKIDDVQSQIRDAIATKIKSEETKKNPDLTKIKVHEKEMQALENGDFPKWIERKQKNAVIDANKELVKPLREMKAVYIRSKDLDKAELIDKELTKLEEEINSPIGKKAVPKQLAPFAEPTLWSEHASTKIRESAEIAEIRNRLAALNVHGEIIVYQHDNLDGRFYHCLVKNGVVIRHDGQTSAWALENGDFVFKTVSADRSKTWLARWTFDATKRSFVTINQNSKSSSGKIIYGDPASFFAPR
jgi:hypothetical protein